MNDDYKRFIDSLESPSMKSVAKHTKFIGEHDYTEISKEKITDIILAMKPKSPASVIQIAYMLNIYAKFLGREDLSSLVYSLDKGEIWQKAKDAAPKKFISNNSFTELYHDIGVHEEFNGFFQQTLFRCVYEGIYNDDMSVVKNLRASDIKDNIVTLREDNGHTYDFEISSELANHLKELGTIDTWERRNGRGICKIRTTGVFGDCCFKIENRKGSKENAYRFSYYRILRKIAKDYVGYSLLPFDIYASGIMYRVKQKLAKHSITLEEAFTIYAKDRIVHNIVENELRRCNCNSSVANFRMIVKGHLDVFNE